MENKCTMYPLGTDIHGNITRLDNKIQELPDKMLRWQDELENLKVQLENAKEEAQKEFPQEEELAEKVARLGELNVLLDMDKKDQVLLDDGEGVEIEPEQKKKERERRDSVCQRVSGRLNVKIAQSFSPEKLVIVSKKEQEEVEHEIIIFRKRYCFT